MNLIAKCDHLVSTRKVDFLWNYLIAKCDRFVSCRERKHLNDPDRSDRTLIARCDQVVSTGEITPIRYLYNMYNIHTYIYVHYTYLIAFSRCEQEKKLSGAHFFVLVRRRAICDQVELKSHFSTQTLSEAQSAGFEPDRTCDHRAIMRSGCFHWSGDLIPHRDETQRRVFS